MSKHRDITLSQLGLDEKEKATFAQGSKFLFGGGANGSGLPARKRQDHAKSSSLSPQRAVQPAPSISPEA